MIDRDAFIKAVLDKKDEIIEQMGQERGDEVLQHLVEIVQDLIDLTTMEFHKLTGTSTNQVEVDIEHLKAQLLQHIDLVIDVTPWESMSWLISLLLQIALKI